MLTKTKDRVGAVLVAVAAVVGLVLVFSTHKPAGDDDDKPATSQVQQAPGQQAPAQDRDDDAPAPGQAPGQAPAQAPAPGQQPPADKDDDGN